MVELLAPQTGDTLLDLAAGPGDTGFLAASHLGRGGRLISTDAVPEMVEAARRRGEELGVTNADYRVADMTASGLPAGSVDGVLCRFGIMLVPDPEAAAQEIARVLRPGAVAALAVWAEPEANEWITAAGRAALSLGLMQRPAPDEPGPFRLADTRELRAVLERGGLRVSVLDDVGIVWRAQSVAEWWEATADTSRMLATVIATAREREIEELRAAAGGLLAGHIAPDGSLTVPGLARVALAARP